MMNWGFNAQRLVLSSCEHPVIKVGRVSGLSRFEKVPTHGLFCLAVQSNRRAQSNLKHSVNVSYFTCSLSVSLFLTKYIIHRNKTNLERKKYPAAIVIHAVSDSASLFIALLMMAPSPLVSLQ